MQFRDRIAANRRRFYAGKHTPDKLYAMHGSRSHEDSDAVTVCFSRLDDPGCCYVGSFSDSRIVPPGPDEEAAALDFAETLINRGKLQAKTVLPVRTPLVTAITSDEYFRCRTGADMRRRRAVRSLRTSLHRFPPKYRLGFALLVIGIASFLTLSYSRWIVWSEFFLLNGSYVNEHRAAWIYFAWSVPLTLFNAFFVDKYHGYYSILLLSFAPIAIRHVSLLRNYSVALMLVVAGVLIAAVCLAFLLKRKSGAPLFASVETAKMVGATLLMAVFSFCIVVDLLLPNRAETLIRSQAAQTESMAEDESRALSAEELQLLNSPEWDSLSAEKRCELLLSIVQTMSPKLGVDTPALSLDAQMPGNEAGFYDHSEHAIHLWRSFIERCSAADAVNVVLHELYHAYEHAVVSSTAINWDSPDVRKYPYFRAASTWKGEFETYISGDRWDVNTEKYREQAVESDACAFAAYYQDRFVYSD